MKDWLRISIFLSVFGFLKEIRPSEPFVYQYLVGPWFSTGFNNTEEVVSQQIFPIGTYAYLVLLVVVFLITDLCRYKPLIIVLGLSGIIVWSMLLWCKTLLEMQIVQVFYGTFMAAEVAYYTYIYAKVPKEYYAQVTAHTRAAILAGRCVSGVIAQLLVQFYVLDYKGLNYITFSAMIAATIWSLFLPSVERSIYFHRESAHEKRYLRAFVLMKEHFIASFSIRYVTKWSIWWALATCGFLMVQTYSQRLWSIVHSNPSEALYNGAVEAILTLVGCFGALSISCLKTDWKQRGELVLSLCSILSGALLIISSQANYIIICYACYIAYGGLYHFVITIATSEVAKYIVEDSYGLVFGFNTLLALALQTIATLCLVTGDIGWDLSARNQFLAYGIYHMGIATIFIIIGLFDWLKNHADLNKTY